MNSKKSRRQFLKNLSILPVGVAVSGFLPKHKVLSENHSIQNGPESKIKTSLNAWSYYQELYKHLDGEDGGMSLYDMLEECARLDFDAVDPTGYFFPDYPDAPERSYINEFKRRAFELGLDISGTGIRNDFATADKTTRRDDIDLAKRWIEVAAEMGAPVIRVFAGEKPENHNWDEASVWLSEALKECAEHGKEYGVIVGVQNHGGMLKTGDEVLKILDMTNSDWLGTIVDTGHFYSSNPYDDIEKVVPYAVNWQVKKLMKGRQGDEIDMHKLVGIIRDGGYRGYVPIETLPAPGDEEGYDAYAEVSNLLNKFRVAL